MSRRRKKEAPDPAPMKKTVLTVGMEELQYLTIAEAVFAAKEGDLIMLMDGVYEEPINFSFGLELVARHKGRAIIQLPPVPEPEYEGHVNSADQGDAMVCLPQRELLSSSDPYHITNFCVPVSQQLWV